MKVSVYIASTLDGFIARKNGELDWLPGADGETDSAEDFGFHDFMDSVDVMVIGRKTFDMVISFGEWPYTGKRVIVLTSKQIRIPSKLSSTVEVKSCHPAELVQELTEAGHQHLYVDGGKTIQSFLKDRLIQELTIFRVPVLIGSGTPLFGKLDKDIHFHHVQTTSFENGFVESKYELIP
ncbi:MAG: dihydrofolate reductase family protein [Planctomycetes bacterium]|nr:dihydrofolate reductase family protein [Planctomycetota bacterium]MCH9723874.1 dihydrofolate reductase family protein [Planctomycetota bacterium]MCH9778600.1 dihydrofolate reductase family protein [Planctomycetota bacterium]MDF1743620.1 dihydrofolate reductase family protein [Gimesia sp.]